MHGFLKVFSFFLALGCAKISYNPQKSKVYTFSADPNYCKKCCYRPNSKNLYKSWNS
jgi:hypothetical protein